MNDIAAASRWPIMEFAPSTDAELITAEIRGKLPPSPHAICDMLDTEAARMAKLMQRVIAGCASDAFAVKPFAVAGHPPPKPKKGKPAPPTVNIIARDYWAVLPR